MTRDHFIHVIKPKILEKMKSKEEVNKLLMCGKQPLITMKWNGDFIIEFGVSKEADFIEIGINVTNFVDVIDEVN